MRKARVLMVTSLLITLPLVLGQGGCPGNDGNGDGDPDITIVRMQNIAFVPSDVTIEVGQTVRWVNNDFIIHTVTSGSPGDPDAGGIFDSGNLGFRGTFEHTFNEAGTFVYFCETHPNIMFDATVTVEEPAEEAD